MSDDDPLNPWADRERRTHTLADGSTVSLLLPNAPLPDFRPITLHNSTVAELLELEEEDEPTTVVVRRPYHSDPGEAPTLGRFVITTATRRLRSLPPLVDMEDVGPSLSDLVIESRR